MHVLLVAYQCGNGMGSVSQIGWEWFRRLTERARVTLVTHVRNRANLEAETASASLEIIYIDTEWFAGPLYRLASRLFPTSQHAVFLLSSLDYFVFDRVANRKLRRLNSKWNVVHVVTPVSPQAHSTLHRLGIPLIRGPLNGGLGVPKHFQQLLGPDQTWLYKLRNVGALFDIASVNTRRTDVILTANASTRAVFSDQSHERFRTMLENGVDLTVFYAAPWPCPPSADRSLRILFAGRLVPFKALPLLFEAVSRVQKDFPVEVTVAGSGPMETEWRCKANELGVAHITFFLGECGQARIAEEMRRCHVFCLPSIRESGGAVLLEAMASARPVIAVRYGGPAEVVNDQNGLAVPADGPEEVISGFEQGLRQIFLNPDEWKKKGERGRLEAERLYSWEAKINQACSLYQELTRS